LGIVSDSTLIQNQLPPFKLMNCEVMHQPSTQAEHNNRIGGIWNAKKLQHCGQIIGKRKARIAYYVQDDWYTSTKVHSMVSF